MEELFQPFGADLDLVEGVLLNPDRRLARRASSMRGHYADAEALEALIAAGDPLHYEVFEKTVPQRYGHLQIGVSITQPGVVGQECFMTKGHYHLVLETGEMYQCLRGRGYMLMKTSDGRSAWQEFHPGRVVYVPPYWAHRSVNCGDEPLSTFFVYPAEAGHNYGDIEQEGFPLRVFRREGRIEIVASR